MTRAAIHQVNRTVPRQTAVTALKLILLSDTHGFLDPRISELARACDLAVHAGDVGSADVLRALRPRQGRVIAVKGNNDLPEKWPRGQMTALTRLERYAAVDLPGGQLVITHGDAYSA